MVWAHYKKKRILWKDLLDFYNIELPNSNEKEKNRRKQIMQRIIKEKTRNHSFQYMTKFIGKGFKGVLRKLHIIDSSNNIIKTYINR